jgi:multidrug efflux pump subunit AcrA (membrane-fusion protein)
MKLKSPHFDKLKSLTKKQKKLILAGIALLLLILAACYTVFIAPLLQKEQWIYKEETVERGTLKVGVTESGSLEYNTKSIDYDLTLDVSDDDEDDSDDDDDTVQKYLKIEEIYAASGQRVTEGEELLKFTEDSVEAVRALLQNAVVEAQADYAEAESTYELSLLEDRLRYPEDQCFLCGIHPQYFRYERDEQSGISAGTAGAEAGQRSFSAGEADRNSGRLSGCIGRL